MRLQSMTLFAAILLVTSLLGQSQQSNLSGAIGKDDQYGSGWLKLTTPVDFKKGEKLRLSIGGSATKIVVRLLPQGANPNTSAGALPKPFAVPDKRVVEIVLNLDYANVAEISVHGLTNPWDEFPLGSGNGPATLLAVERVRAK
jgi:hypothetical protein